MTYLDVNDLSVGYAGLPVASGVSFSLAAGDALFVVGENGTGKSTLLKTLLGLQPPLAGTFTLAGGVAGKVGYLPQRGESPHDFPASAWEVVLSGRAVRLGIHPFYSKADKLAATKAMQRAGMSALRDKPFGSLSGGQQQRVLLARALACEPLVLVLDEPTTGLDPAATEALYATMDGLRGEGVGVLAVTHDVTAALPHATGVLEMRDGCATLLPAAGYGVRRVRDGRA